MIIDTESKAFLKSILIWRIRRDCSVAKVNDYGQHVTRISLLV